MSDKLLVNELLQAAAKGDISEIKQLVVQKNVDVNSTNQYKETALHIAVREGYCVMVKTLIADLDCNVNLQNSLGKSPLHLALDNLDIWKTLLNHRFINYEIEDIQGNRPLHLAAKLKDGNFMANVLFEDFNPKTGYGTNREIDLNAKNKFGDTALHIAIKASNFGNTRILLNFDNTKVNATDAEGNTALHLAIITYDKGIMNSLLEHPHINPEIENLVGDRPLHLAAKLDRTNGIDLLARRGYIDIYSKNRNNKTALILAAERGYLFSVKEIIEIGYSTDSKHTEELLEAIRVAKIGQHTEVIDLLEERETKQDNSD